LGAALAAIIGGSSYLLSRDDISYKINYNAVHRSHQEKAHLFQHKDLYYERFEQCLDAKLSDQDMRAIIEKETGLHLCIPSFNIPDKYGLTLTQRFYDCGLILDQYPVMLRPWLEKVPRLCSLVEQDGYLFEMSFNTNAGYFDTAKNKEYELVIKNLALYLAAKSGSNNPKAVAQFVATWVSDNLPPFFDRTKEEAVFSIVGKDHSFVNSREIMKNEGLCIDYSNLFCDICNELGIPSRTISLASSVMVFDKKKLPEKYPEAFYREYHSIAEVRLPEPLYIDPSRGAEKGFFNNPAAYFYDFSNEIHPGGFVSHLTVHGAMPAKMIPDKIKAFVDSDRQHFFTKGYLTEYLLFLKKELHEVQEGKELFFLIYQLDSFKKRK